MYVAGGATIISMLVLISMLKTKIGDFEGKFFFSCEEKPQLYFKIIFICFFNLFSLE